MKSLILVLSPLVVACSSPKTTVRPDPPPTLADTVWFMNDLDVEDPVDQVLTFHADGRMSTTNTRDTTPDNDRWQPAADGGIQFVFNGGFSTYTGRRVSPDRIEGTATNAKEHTWSFILCLQKGPDDDGVEARCQPDP